MPHRFVLEGIDPNTNCIAHELPFEVDDLRQLAALLDMDARSFDGMATYPIEADELERLKSALGLTFDAGETEVWLRSARPLDALPYKVHTNRELALMLAGVKPLAVFDVASTNSDDDEDSPEKYFAPYVASGRFIRREHTYHDGRLQLLYALPTETLRIDSYIRLLETAQTAGWSEDSERMQGALLGYEDWQNDAYIETIYRPDITRRSPR